jgi:hypothetical protein
MDNERKAGCGGMKNEAKGGGGFEGKKGWEERTVGRERRAPISCIERPRPQPASRNAARCGGVSGLLGGRNGPWNVEDGWWTDSLVGDDTTMIRPRKSLSQSQSNERAMFTIDWQYYGFSGAWTA